MHIFHSIKKKSFSSHEHFFLLDIDECSLLEKDFLGIECSQNEIGTGTHAFLRGYFPAKSQALHISLVLRKKTPTSETCIYINKTEAKSILAKSALITAQLVFH